MKKKDTTLEDILLEMTSSKENIKENLKKMNNTLLNEGMKKHIMEDEDEDEMDEEDDMMEDETEMEDEMEGMDDEPEMEDDDMEDMDFDDDDSLGDVDFVDGDGEGENSDINMLISKYGLVVDENGDYHATLTPEQIEEMVEHIPDNAEIVMVKKPSYHVTVSDLNSMPDDTELEIDDEDLAQGLPSIGGGDEFDEDEDEMGEEDDDELELEDEDDDEIKKEGYGKSMKESLLMKRNKMYESVIRDLNKKVDGYKRALQENAAKSKKMKDALLEGRNIISQLTVINENLSNVTQLFGKYHLTAKQRSEILEGFSKVATTNESKLLMEVYNKQFSKSTEKPPVKKSEILEHKGGQKILVKENEMKEKAKTQQSDFFRFSNHNI